MPSFLPVTEGIDLAHFAPATFAHAAIAPGHAAHGRQQERPRLLGDGGGVRPRAVGDDDAALARCGDVDALEARADGADDLERGHRLDVRALESVRAVGLHRANLFRQRIVEQAGMVRRVGPVVDRVGLGQMIAAVLRHVEDDEQVDGQDSAFRFRFVRSD